MCILFFVGLPTNAVMSWLVAFEMILRFVFTLFALSKVLLLSYYCLKTLLQQWKGKKGNIEQTINIICCLFPRSVVAFTRLVCMFTWVLYFSPSLEMISRARAVFVWVRHYLWYYDLCSLTNFMFVRPFCFVSKKNRQRRVPIKWPRYTHI